MKKLLLFAFILTGCGVNERTKNYRIHSLKDGQVQIKELDSAYVTGDTIALPFDSVNTTQFVILQRVE